MDWCARLNLRGMARMRQPGFPPGFLHPPPPSGMQKTLSALVSKSLWAPRNSRDRFP